MCGSRHSELATAHEGKSSEQSVARQSECTPALKHILVLVARHSTQRARRLVFGSPASEESKSSQQSAICSSERIRRIRHWWLDMASSLAREMCTTSRYQSVLVSKMTPRQAARCDGESAMLPCQNLASAIHCRRTLSRNNTIQQTCVRKYSRILQNIIIDGHFICSSSYSKIMAATFPPCSSQHAAVAPAPAAAIIARGGRRRRSSSSSRLWQRNRTVIPLLLGEGGGTSYSTTTK